MRIIRIVVSICSVAYMLLPVSCNAPVKESGDSLYDAVVFSNDPYSKKQLIAPACATISGKKLKICLRSSFGIISAE